MGSKTIELGLTVAVPTPGTRNYAQDFLDDFGEPISSHDHSENGKGQGVRESVENGITAAGSTQGDAYAVTARVTVASVVAASTGVKLRANADDGVGAYAEIFNDGANTLSIYPASGEAIDSLGTNNPYSLASGSHKAFRRVSSTLWRSL